MLFGRIHYIRFSGETTDGETIKGKMEIKERFCTEEDIRQECRRLVEFKIDKTFKTFTIREV